MGSDGDRGALQHLGDALAAGEASRAHLDEMTAVIVVQAIAAAAAPLPAQVGEHGELVRDPRSKRQRDVDALVTLLQRGAAASEPAVAESARVTVAATVEGYGPVSTATFGYVSCGATLRRVLTSPAGAVLDLGRSHRLATPHQRTALAVRDGGCVAPGCAIAPGACEAHHFPEWEHGGSTDLDAMVLLCPGHHRAWHAHHLNVRLRPDRTVEAPRNTRG